MNVQKLSNGQFVVNSGNCTLIQTIANGIKINECMIKREDYYELMDCNNPLFKPLFIALHNFKSSC